MLQPIVNIQCVGELVAPVMDPRIIKPLKVGERMVWLFVGYDGTCRVGVRVG